MIAAGSSLMTIDSPYTCCWGWALVFGYQAARAAVGVGLAAGRPGGRRRHPGEVHDGRVAAVAGAVPADSRDHRALLRQRGFWIACAVAAVCCLPILVWNAQHDWVTVKHVLRLAGLKTTALSPAERTPIAPLAGAARLRRHAVRLVAGYWFVVWLAAMWSHRPWKEADDGTTLSVVAVGADVRVFLAFSLKTNGGEPNWPITRTSRAWCWRPAG